MNLPYSVIRGEVVAIPISVFNYMKKDMTVTVVLENNGDFEFAEASNEVHDTKRKNHLYPIILYKYMLHPKQTIIQ